MWKKKSKLYKFRIAVWFTNFAILELYHCYANCFEELNSSKKINEIILINTMIDSKTDIHILHTTYWFLHLNYL